MVILGGPLARGEAPEDGLYLWTRGEELGELRTSDGIPVRLGDRADLTVREARMTAVDNGNEVFHLSLTVPYDALLGPSTYMLVAAGQVFRQSGSGSSHQEASFLHFQVRGEGVTAQVAKLFGARVDRRVHPGHRLQVAFVPDHEVFAVGDDIRAKLVIRNVGDHPVAYLQGGRNRGARDNQYEFLARRDGQAILDTGNGAHFGGLAVKRVIQPDETFIDTVPLDRWFTFNQPGFYEIHGSYYLAFLDPDSDTFTTTWEDYATGAFPIRIETKAD